MPNTSTGSAEPIPNTAGSSQVDSCFTASGSRLPKNNAAFLLACESAVEGTISDFPHFMDGFFLFSDQPHAFADFRFVRFPLLSLGSSSRAL